MTQARRFEPYDPDAIDGDNDGLVQDGTPWERPVGTRILDEFGKELERGYNATSRNPRHTIVDRDGNKVDYTPKVSEPDSMTSPTVTVQKISSSLGTIGHPTLAERGHANTPDYTDPPDVTPEVPKGAGKPGKADEDYARQQAEAFIAEAEGMGMTPDEYRQYFADELASIDAELADTTNSLDEIATLNVERDLLAKHLEQQAKPVSLDDQQKSAIESTVRNLFGGMYYKSIGEVRDYVAERLERINERLADARERLNRRYAQRSLPTTQEHIASLLYQQKLLKEGLAKLEDVSWFTAPKYQNVPGDAIEQQVADLAAEPDRIIDAARRGGRDFEFACRAQLDYPLEKINQEIANRRRESALALERAKRLAGLGDEDGARRNAEAAADAFLKTEVLSALRDKLEQRMDDPALEVPDTPEEAMALLRTLVSQRQDELVPGVRSLREMKLTQELAQKVAESIFTQSGVGGPVDPDTGVRERIYEWESVIDEVNYGTTTITVEGSIYHNGKKIGDWERTLDLSTGEVSHNYFTMEDDWADYGIGGRFVFDSMYQMRDLGFTEVRLLAANGDGYNGFVKWAQMGFEYTGNDIAGLDIDDVLDILGLDDIDELYGAEELVLDHAAELDGLRISAEMRYDLDNLPPRAAPLAMNISPAKSPKPGTSTPDVPKIPTVDRATLPAEFLDSYDRGIKRAEDDIHFGHSSRNSLDEAINNLTQMAQIEEDDILRMSSRANPEFATRSMLITAQARRQRVLAEIDALRNPQWFTRRDYERFPDDEVLDAVSRFSNDADVVAEAALIADRKLRNLRVLTHSEIVTGLNRNNADIQRLIDEDLEGARQALKAFQETGSPEDLELFEVFTRAAAGRRVTHDIQKEQADKLRQEIAAAGAITPSFHSTANAVAAFQEASQVPRNRWGIRWVGATKVMDAASERIANDLYVRSGTARDGSKWSTAIVDMQTYNDEFHVRGHFLNERGDVIGRWSRIVHLGSSGPMWIDHSVIAMDEQHQDLGIAGRFVFESMYEAKDAGFESVTLEAANGVGWNGFTRWPAMGFRRSGDIGGDDLDKMLDIMGVLDPADVTEQMMVDYADELEGLDLHAEMEMMLRDLPPKRDPRARERPQVFGMRSSSSSSRVELEPSQERLIRSIQQQAELVRSTPDALTDIDAHIESFRSPRRIFGVIGEMTPTQREEAVRRLEEIRREITEQSWFVPIERRGSGAFFDLLSDPHVVTEGARAALRDAQIARESNDTLQDAIDEVNASLEDYERQIGELRASANDPKVGEAERAMDLMRAAKFTILKDGLIQIRSGWEEELAELRQAEFADLPDGPAAKVARIKEIYESGRDFRGGLSEVARQEVDRLYKALALDLFEHSGVTRDGTEWSTLVEVDDLYYDDYEAGFAVSGIIRNADGEMIGSFDRSINLETGEVHHDLFTMNGEWADSGIGGKFVFDSLYAMRDAGLEKVTLHAANGWTYNGLVKWPAMGFRLTSAVNGPDIDDVIRILGVEHRDDITEELLVKNADRLAGLNVSANMEMDLADLPPRGERMRRAFD
jgi:hypothetical protein